MIDTIFIIIGVAIVLGCTFMLGSVCTYNKKTVQRLIKHNKRLLNDLYALKVKIRRIKELL